MSYSEPVGRDERDARPRARHVGAAPDSNSQARDGRPATEGYGRAAPGLGQTRDLPVVDGYVWDTGDGPADRHGHGQTSAYAGLLAGPYTGTGERPHQSGTGPDRPPLPQNTVGGGRVGDDEGLTADPPDLLARRRSGARRHRAGRTGRAGRTEEAPSTSVSSSAAAPTPVIPVISESTPAGTPDRSSRAGRNLSAAIAVGVGLAVVVLGTLLLWRPAFLGVLVAAVGVGVWEMVRAVRTAGARPSLPPLLAGGVLMAVLAWRIGPDALALGLLVTVLATLVWRLADGPEGYQRDSSAAILIAVYVPFLAGFAALLASGPDGDRRILVTLAAVVLSDTGGYAAGVFLGRHPLAPSVSPKKSWEGFGGSVLAAALGSAVLLYLLLDVAPWWGAAFGLAVSVAAVVGDLGESMIKRDLGVKDMSSLLPGHGGLMDRLDSILFALPVSYLVLALIGPVG